MKPATRIAVVFLAVVAVLHFLRLALQVEVRAGSYSLPLWMSGVAALFTGGLAYMLWRENRRA